MSKVEIWQNEVVRLNRRLQELEGFERPSFGRDMTAERISRIRRRIDWYQQLIDTSEDDADSGAPKTQRPRAGAATDPK